MDRGLPTRSHSINPCDRLCHFTTVKSAVREFKPWQFIVKQCLIDRGHIWRIETWMAQSWLYCNGFSPSQYKCWYWLWLLTISLLHFMENPVKFVCWVQDNGCRHKWVHTIMLGVNMMSSMSKWMPPGLLVLLELTRSGFYANALTQWELLLFLDPWVYGVDSI